MEFITHVIQQWGAAGVVAVAAGWVLYDSWKKAKTTEEWMRKQLEAASTSRANTQSDLSDIYKAISEIREENNEWRNEIANRIDTLEKKIDEQHPNYGMSEGLRLQAISSIAPSIHALINEGLNTCACDHIAVALLHNGTVSLSGIPYIKAGVIAEKYKPIRHPNDIDLMVRYKDEDIVSHNKLPAAVVQNPQIEFAIAKDSTLIEIDAALYNKCLAIGIKRIAFEAVRDMSGLTTGFIVIYKFDDSPLNMVGLHNTTVAIERLYQNMMLTMSQ